jgi:drug/metabolite transporter (DMT)-like permease
LRSNDNLTSCFKSDCRRDTCFDRIGRDVGATYGRDLERLALLHRLSITTTLSAQDLVALRYAIGCLLFLPVLIHGARRISPRGWREGLTLAFLQGAPLAMLVTLGLRFAPAGHMAALSPGLLPLFAASVGYVFLNEPLSSTRICAIALIGFGALALVFVSVGVLTGSAWKGDVLFVCAGFMGATYAVRMRRSGLSALEGAALISVYSMLLYLPLYATLWLPTSSLFAVSSASLGKEKTWERKVLGKKSLGNDRIIFLAVRRPSTQTQ